eukprot:6182430-Pleurochrysis_carterae.AAC.1
MGFIEELLRERCAYIPLIQGDSFAQSIRIPVHVYFCGDFAGVRAIEGSVCGCPPDVMHAVPSARDISSIDDLPIL